MAAKPGEHKTVQARILPTRRRSAGRMCRGPRQRRGGASIMRSQRAPSRRADASPYFDDLLDAQVELFNPKYAEGPGALVGDLRRLHSDIAGNRDFLAYLRNAQDLLRQGSGRELNLVVIDYDNPDRQRLRGHRGVLRPQRPVRHAGGRGLPDQRHPGAGDRVQERDARTKPSRSASTRSAATTPRRRR